MLALYELLYIAIGRGEVTSNGISNSTVIFAPSVIREADNAWTKTKDSCWEQGYVNGGDLPFIWLGKNEEAMVALSGEHVVQRRTLYPCIVRVKPETIRQGIMALRSRAFLS